MKKILWAVAFVALLWACNSDKEMPRSNESILINTDTNALNQRVSMEGAGVVGIIVPDDPSGRKLVEEDEKKAGSLPLILAAQVDPPKFEGKVLKATHVDIDGDYAFVSYNKPGPEFLGAVEIYNISNPTQPKITAQAIFKTANINSVAYQNGILYLAAAFDIDQEKEMEAAAHLVFVTVSNGQFTSEFYKSQSNGQAAVDVAVSQETIALATGSEGTISTFDLKGGKINELVFPDVRSVKFSEMGIAAKSGQTGIIFADKQSLTIKSRIQTDPEIPESKRTIDVDQDWLYAAEGKNGAGIYLMSQTKEVARIPIFYKPQGVAEEDMVTNAVSYSENLLIMANGGAGVAVVGKDEQDSFFRFGVLELDGSANFVKLYKNHLFVATGGGGLQILKITRKSETKPGGIVCDNLETYSGSRNLNVNGGQSKAYGGSLSLQNLNVGGHLLFCGSMAVSHNINLNSGGLFEFNGSLAFGQSRGNTSMNINSNAVMRVSGDLVIYGNLNLNSGGTLEFVGDNNTITIYGDVRINNDASIKGNFKDTEGKLNKR